MDVVKCPFCGQKCRPLETPGQEPRCPACLNLIPARPAPAPALTGGMAPAAGAAPNRTVLAQPEAMVHYRCPRCNKPLESPASFAGQKLNCPDCNQRLQIPQPSTPLPGPPINKTILAAEDRPAPAPTPSSRPPAPTAAVPVVEAVDDGPSRAAPAPAARHESCLECGADVTKQARIQTCPDCGSIFCSARCYRDHRDHAHAPRPKSRPRPVECPYCGSTAQPYEVTEISQAGWITFALLLIFFFPLFWIGLLMTERRVKCADCGRRLD